MKNLLIFDSFINIYTLYNDFHSIDYFYSYNFKDVTRKLKLKRILNYDN